MAGLSRVLVVGGGIGGLALAQGLVQAGIDVAVFEREAESSSRLQGYRLSLTPDGLRALKSLLPAERWEEVVAACTEPLAGINFLSQRLETRFYKKTPEPADDVSRYSSISRITLREILLRGLDDRIAFGRTCKGYHVAEDERVECLFDQGRPEVGDIIVGADGTRSAIREQLLPSSNRYETGVSAIAGKVPRKGAEQVGLLAPPIGESAVVVGDDPQGLFIADHQLTAGQAGDSYVFWSFLTKRERFPVDVARVAPERLIDIVKEMTENWHPRLKDLIAEAVPETALLLNYASSRRPEAWSDPRVTLLGDAVHNMPPTGGEGANMALKDADTLRSALCDHATSPSTALSVYQATMLDYAFEAVATSMANLDRMVKRSN